MNAIEKIIETLENYVVPSQLDDARAELAALREVAEALGAVVSQAKAQFNAGDRHATFNQAFIKTLEAALAKLAAVKGGQK